ncbi:MAG: metallophosphoesterase [Acetobacterales bacterium]
MTLRLVQVSDLHLSRSHPFFFHNWDVAVEAINADPPDLVVASGDLALHGDVRPDDLAFVHAQLDRLSAPVLRLPGNHDCGDNLPQGDGACTAERLRQYRDLVGPDRWAERLGDWTLVGINAQLYDTGLSDAGEQTEWLTGTLEGLGGRPFALFLHKPLFLNEPDEARHGQHCLSPQARGPLLRLLRKHPPALVASGHLHAWRRRRWHGATMIWAPALGFVLRLPEMPSSGGTRRVGWVEYELGDGRLRAAFRRDQRMIDHDISNWVAEDSQSFYRRIADAPFRSAT